MSPSEPDPTAASGPPDDLVARTAGPQPWRRVFHAVSGVATVAVVLAWDPPQRTLLGLLGALTAALLVLDLARVRWPSANRLFYRWFVRLATPREAGELLSSTWYAAGMFLALALFPRAEALSAILVLALADPVASYAGRRWGRRPFLGGTVEGSLLFLGVAALVLVLRHPPAAAAAGALAATVVERIRGPLDDNLTVPVVCAGMLTLVAWGL